MYPKKPLTEKQIQNLIMNYLRTVKDIYFWRQNSGSFTQKAKTALSNIVKNLPIPPNIKVRILGEFYRRVGKYDCASEPGLPDIIVIYKGYFVGLEVKTKTGRQRQTQLRAENNIKRAGGFYFVVRSLEDVKRAFEEVDKAIQK